ncbi:hypothetical protein Q4S45_00980 [Massilia sp. R2A-15]|uniref:hypothetical protein n=1 Tax=Massilia sp. R2A-15 TaxID=3064278 RepID=UPI0027356A3E|nr:hypothetical protein [Massilia sp. R2A-15]WLI89722.1 hypothetical protein Q4S45_00980 [Massilia sp. R2A-15]
MKALRMPAPARLARWLRGFRDGDGSAPRYLALPFIAGCLVLFAFFVIPPQTYSNIRPLFEPRAPHTASAATPAAEEIPRARDIAVRVVRMETNGRVPEAVDPERARLTQDRVAINILIRSGYVSIAQVDNYAVEGTPQRSIYHLTPDRTALACASIAADAAGSDEAAQEKSRALRATAARLALAAVAVEKFHRSELHRRVEWAYARAFSALTGRLPDISLGPAQIRVSTVRRIGATVGGSQKTYSVLHESDAELTKTLLDECRSLRLSAAIMSYYLGLPAGASAACGGKNRPDCPSEAERAANNYTGHRRATSAIVDYGPIVDRMQALLSEN